MQKLYLFLIAVLVFALFFGVLSLFVALETRTLLFLIPGLAAGEVFVVQPLVDWGKTKGWLE